MEQQTAVMSYLEDLLLDVPDAIVDERPDNIVTVFPQPVKTPEAPVIPVQEVVEKETVVTTRQEQPLEEKETLVTTPQEKPVEENVSAQTCPDWVEDEFQCLMFKVVGISMAVPLHRLNGVIPWQNDLTPMPGHSDAFLGLLRHLDKNVKVMDTARVILPTAQLQQLDTEDERINKIILMDEGRWGLACDDVGEVITLNKNEVRWRTTSGKRPWLAGTISERLCALQDTEVLAEILSEGLTD